MSACTYILNSWINAYRPGLHVPVSAATLMSSAYALAIFAVVGSAVWPHALKYLATSGDGVEG
eukprot:9493815-Pyramimonas_sp.AAC.2